MLNLLKLVRWSMSLLLGMAISGGVVSVSGQSTKTGDDNSKGSVWLNNSILEEAPYVNAEKVENRGLINAATPDNVPFYFFNTKYFTNSGTINIRKDFEFSTFKTENQGVDFDPKKAKVFHNHSTGKIISISDEFSTGSVRINAERIINKGLISAENAGVLDLEGDDVNLVRGGIEIKSGPNFDHPNGLDDFGQPLAWGYNLNYLNGSLGPYQQRRFSSNPGGAGTLLVKQDWGVRDVFWGLRVGANYNGSTPAGVFGFGDFYSFIAPGELVWEEIASPYSLTGKYTPPYGQYALWDGLIGGSGYQSSFSTSFILVGDNEYHETYQGILLKNTGSDKVMYDGKFVPMYAPAGSSPERFYLGAVAGFTVPEGITNVIHGVNDTGSIYIIDEQPNVAYAANGYLLNSRETASKNFGVPQNFVVTRYTPDEFQNGIPGNYVPESQDFFRGEQRSTTFNDSYYGFRITNVVSRLPFSELPAPDLENIESKTQAGLVRVKAKNLDLRNARIRAEGGIRIETEHLIGSTNAVLDSQNLSLNLGSTNGVLVVTNIVQESVERFTGGVKSYSVAWGNNYKTTGGDLIDREKIFFVEDPAAEVTVNLHYHFLVIDAYLNTEVPVTVTDLTLNSDKVLIKDAMRVSELLSVNANSLSIHRNLKLGKETFLGSGVYSKVEGQAVWDNKVAPNLENFTNFAILQIPGQAKFGNDRNNSYQSWVNKGTTLAQDIFIDSDYVQNNGDLIAEGTVSIDAKQMVLQDGNINTGESLVLNAENLKMRFQTNTIGSQLVLNVSNVLSDGGVGANNIMTLERGVVLQQKPKAGNLLGTEIIATANDFVIQEMDWNAKDYGVTIKGFENNAALGRLILKNGKLSKFEFLGSEEGNNAMYVDYVEFDQLTKDDIKDGSLAVLDIKPGFTLYFAASNLPAEELDGMYNGRLRWVKEYPGHNSSMPVYISGIDKTIRVNRSFRESIAYDTDDDGIANGYDLSPFGNGVPKISSVSLDVDRKIRIKWTGLPSTLYRLEYKETLSDSNWKILTEYYNDQYIVREITHQEILSNKKISKFYRVLYIE